MQDILYATGSFFYLFASMRDDGWWWWMPLAGKCALPDDERSPMELTHTPKLDNVYVAADDDGDVASMSLLGGMRSHNGGTI